MGVVARPVLQVRYRRDGGEGWRARAEWCSGVGEEHGASTFDVAGGSFEECRERAHGLLVPVLGDAVMLVDVVPEGER